MELGRHMSLRSGSFVYTLSVWEDTSYLRPGGGSFTHTSVLETSLGESLHGPVFGMCYKHLEIVF